MVSIFYCVLAFFLVNKKENFTHLLRIIALQINSGGSKKQATLLGINLSIKKAAELTHNMYQITYTLPESKHTKIKLLKMEEQQAELYQIIKEII